MVGTGATAMGVGMPDIELDGLTASFARAFGAAQDEVVFFMPSGKLFILSRERSERVEGRRMLAHVRGQR